MLIPFHPLPDYELRVVPDIPGCVRIETVTTTGSVDQELFCTIGQARTLLTTLEDVVGRA